MCKFNVQDGSEQWTTEPLGYTGKVGSTAQSPPSIEWKQNDWITFISRYKSFDFIGRTTSALYILHLIGKINAI